MNRELRSIREQMRSDFEATMTGLAAQRDAMTSAIGRLRIDLNSAIDRLNGDLNNGLTIQEGLLRDHMTKTEQRFGEILDVVERDEARLDAVERRVEALEKKAG